ncbi:chymotrypsin-like protease CTRL-1 [Styela clava]
MVIEVLLRSVESLPHIGYQLQCAPDVTVNGQVYAYDSDLCASSRQQLKAQRSICEEFTGWSRFRMQLKPFKCRVLALVRSGGTMVADSEPFHLNGGEVAVLGQDEFWREYSKDVQDLYSECGKQFTNTQKVLQGDSAIFKKYPWIVAINATVPFVRNKHYCAGALVSTKHVVTAAHCLANRDTGKAYPLNSFLLSFGLLRLSDSPMATRTVKNMYFWPRKTSYNIGKVFDYPRHDIAVIELSQPVRISSNIYPICLPHGEITPEDTTGLIAGWGINSANGILSQTHLQEAAVQNLDIDICRVGYAKHKSLIRKEVSYAQTSNDILCAGSIHKVVNTCRGDSGGPLMFQRCESCSWYLGGIVSFGHPDCTKKIPGAYTKVLSYEKWIREIIKEAPDHFYCSKKVGP